MTKRNTMIEKIWDKHNVHEEEDKPDLIYIDLHLIHEVTSPQAFEGLRLKNRELRRPDLTFATMDHNVPTLNRGKINDPTARLQVETLEANCEEYGVELADINHHEQGIVHIIGTEIGLSQTGKTIIYGDNNTSY